MGNKRLAAALLMAAILLAMGCQRKPAARVHRIDMSTTGFAPAEVAAAPGDTIVWANHDLVPHTATADGRQFDSGTVAPGAEWSLVVRERGRIRYTCIFHPTMKGVIVTP